jgi:DNA-binding CsgD family transcriptional regulator
MQQLEDLIERSDELAPIEDAFDSAEDGGGRLVVVGGPAGIGKSALLGVAQELARARGFAVLSGVGTELERGLSLGVARQLFGRIYAENRHAGGRTSVSAFLAPAATEDQDQGGSFRILDDLYWFANDLSQEAPLLLTVDDCQWCDESSLRYLSYLCRRLDGMDVAVVVARRDGGPPSPNLEDLDQRATSHLNLPPLSLDGVGSLVQRVMGRSPSVHFATVCRDQTGGYPLYLQKMLEVADQRGLDPDDAAAVELQGINAEGLVSHVWHRIEALGADAGTVAGLVAVLGEHADRARIARLGALGSVEVLETITDLIAQGVLLEGDVPRFAHPVIRTAVEERLSARSLDAWHRGAAHLLDREGADIREISGPLIRCLPAGDEWIVDHLREYSRAVLSDGTPGPAVVALQRALAEPPRKNEGVPLLLELAQAKDASGDSSGALDDLDEALRLADSAHQRAEISVVQGKIFALLNRYEAAIQALEAGLEGITGTDPELERLIDVERINCAFISRGFAEQDLERLTAYEIDIPDGPVGMGILTAQAAAAVMKFRQVEKGAALAERALRTGGLRNGSMNTEVWTLATWILILANRADLARSLTERELVQLRQEGHLRDIFTLEVGMASAALNCGDIAVSVSRAQGALAIADPGPQVSWAHLVHALALLEVGDLEAVERALAAAEPQHWDEAVGASYGLYLARAQLRIAQGRLGEAAVDVAEMRRRSDANGDGLLGGDDVWRLIGAILAHHQGDSETARSLASQELEKVRKMGSIGLLGRVLRTAALVGDPKSELELLRESVDLLSSSYCRLEYARSLVEFGAALRRRGERVAARDPLKEGVDLAYRCGGGAVVSQGLAELKATGARPRRLVLDGPEALTPREARMALLAAEGRSNREIAQELYVTLATVEGTLWRAYSKLDISGHGAREALPAALGPLYSAS